MIASMASKYLILTGAIAIVVACRLASGGEATTAVAADPFSMIFRLLADFGALGVFIIYLIWREKRDYTKRERDSERWYAVDQSLIQMVKDTTMVITAAMASMNEVRAALQENVKELRRISTYMATGQTHDRRSAED